MTFVCKCCNKEYPAGEAVTCFICKNTFSNNCANLNDKDTRVLRSKKNINWTCTACSTIDVAGQIAGLTSVIEQLQKQMSEFKVLLSSQSNQPICNNESFTIDDVLSEIDERNAKEKNIIIFNMNESESAAGDLNLVDDIFKHLDVKVDTGKIGIFRLGKDRSEDKIRPLKIVLNSKDEVGLILKKSKNLKTFVRNPKLFINKDLTVRQLGLKRKIITDFHDRKAKGENIYLKYSNGMPQIVVAKNL